jgi:hypothetical protein
MSAWRYICVVSTDSCPSQSAITERSTLCCHGCGGATMSLKT